MPQILSPGVESQRRRIGVMNWRHKPTKPRLQRSYAMKNIDYDFDLSSSGGGCSTSSSSSPSPALRGTRSLDLNPNPTSSFRVGGEIDGELDSLLQRLDISSPDELGIPVVAWEERKKRRSSELLPRSRLYPPFTVRNSCPLTADSSDIQTSELLAVEAEDGAYDDDGGGVVRVRTGGIKGVRPPLLAPPPSTLKPWGNDDCANCSTWDILKSFGPDGSHVNQGGFFSELDDYIGEIASIRRIGETVVLSDSCSFTASSNDDDSSSTTTEHTSHVSPNGRVKHVITSWQKGDLLGSGSFGAVYEGIADDGFFIAVKQVSLLDQGDQGRQSVMQLEQEIALLSQFEHENIVQYYGTDKDESNLYIFLELVTKGSLLSLYQKYILRDSQVSSYTRQILHGLRYLHNRNVVHRDIKCANILVDASGSVKLADFGLAKATKLNDVKSCKGTAFWMAPEVVHQRNQGYGLAADIWSLGCTVLEMLTRQLPYYPLECMAALFKIGCSIPPPVPKSLSKEARDFILQCLQVNPNDRPTAAQLLDHPFVKKPFIYPPASPSPHSYGWRC